ncbi:MAG: TRAP transporter TatT component family protein [Fibrobacterota bacterium]
MVFLALLSVLLFSGCTGISHRINTEIADSLTQNESSVFSRDDDPEFIKDALPFGLKLYESLLEENPDHRGLHATLAAGYTAYSNLFLHLPADTLNAELEDQKKHLRKRAKNHYLRARTYAINGLSLKYDNFMGALSSNSDSLLPLLDSSDADLLYWAGISWMGAFAVDKGNMRLALSMTNAKKLLFRLKDIDPDYGSGSLDNFFIDYYANVPSALGGDPDSARHYFERATQDTALESPLPYITYARSVSVKENNPKEFVQLLEKACSIPPEDDPDNLLIRTAKQQEAEWLLRNENSFFN